jgi:hypothetical protein
MTRADLFVKIEGVNQFAPKFDQQVFTFFIDENSAFNTTVGVLTATDPDSFSNYGVIRYELKNGQDR